MRMTDWPAIVIVQPPRTPDSLTQIRSVIARGTSYPLPNPRTEFLMELNISACRNSHIPLLYSKVQNRYASLAFAYRATVGNPTRGSTFTALVAFPRPELIAWNLNHPLDLTRTNQNRQTERNHAPALSNSPISAQI